MHISNIRKKIAQYDDAEKIQTLRGLGYVVTTRRTVMNWSRCNPVNYLAGRIFLWFWLVLSVAVAGAILLARGWPEQTEIRHLPHPVAEQFRHLKEHFQPFANLTTLQKRSGT